MSNQRNKELALIHIAKKQLGLDDETYRDLLWTVARVRSSSDLDELGRQKVIDHLRACGAVFKRKQRSQPPIDKVDRVNKIRAFLAEANRPDSYGDSMARRMFNVERYEWCTPAQLGKLIAALSYDAKRHGRKTR